MMTMYFDKSGRQADPAVTHFGFSDVAVDARRGLVDKVFNQVATRYDLMNDLMSCGLHRLWKAEAVNWLAPPRGASDYRVLDIAGGTGDIAFRIQDACADARVVVLDINACMLAEGQCKARNTNRSGLCFIQGNGENLPFDDGYFDACTIAFGMRNMTHIDKALDEAFRVLRHGGCFLCLEFSHLNLPGLDCLYDLYSFNVIPVMGRLVAGDADPYRYLVESIRRFPDQERFSDMIRQAGFERVSYRNLSGGVAALHRGWRL